jgi:hypothetical protein
MNLEQHIFSLWEELEAQHAASKAMYDDNKQQQQQAAASSGIGFVAHRANIVKIMLTPYGQDRIKWSMKVQHSA